MFFERLFEGIDTRVMPQGHGSLFKRSKEQIVVDLVKIKELKLKKKKLRLNMLIEEQKKVEKLMEEMKQDIQS